MDSGLKVYIVMLFVLNMNSFVLMSYPKCEDKTASTWTELGGEDFPEETAITDCKNACRTGPNTTLCGLRKNGREGLKAKCYCGDIAVNPWPSCTWDCNRDNENCGGQDSLSAHTVCNPGKRGTDCSLFCPGFCEENVCDVEDGSCHGNCQPGYYGYKCATECPNTDCINGICNKTTGDCIDCPSGWYTSTCQTQCSDHCAQESCTIYEGACDGGCKPGYYQPTCTASCSSNCVQTTCDINNGTCAVGCTDGWYGSHCNNSCPGNCAEECDRHTGDCNHCKDGSYGERCELLCPSNCNQTVCDINTGNCTHGTYDEEDTCIPVWVWPVVVILVVVGPALGAVGMWLFLSRRHKLIREPSNDNKDVTYDNAGWFDVEEEKETGKRTDYVNDFVGAQTRESSTDYVNDSAEPGAYQEVVPQGTIPPNVYDKLEVPQPK